MSDNKYNFGSIVIVEDVLVGVVVKCWDNKTYDVYVRSANRIEPYKESEIEKFIYDREIDI